MGVRQQCTGFHFSIKTTTQPRGWRLYPCCFLPLFCPLLLFPSSFLGLFDQTTTPNTGVRDEVEGPFPERIEHFRERGEECFIQRRAETMQGIADSTLKGV